MTSKISQLQSAFFEKSPYEALTIVNPIDLFYLLGVNLSSGRLLITKDYFWLGVDGRYFTECHEIFQEHVVLTERGDYSPLFQRAHVTTAAFDQLSESWAAIDKLKPFGQYIPINSPTAALRSVKEESEIKKLYHAAELAEKGYHYLFSIIQTGVTEVELARKLQAFWFENGGDGASFEPIITFGERAALPHARPSSRSLKPNEVVLIDIGVKVDHYQSDMTRMVFFGDISHTLQRAAEHVQIAHQRACNALCTGVKATEIDKIARDYIDATEFKGTFTHSTGHGIGLEVHEAPYLRAASSDTLHSTMVVTIEPGIYLPGVGGIRLENSYIIRERGSESLQKSPLIKTKVPKTV